MSIFWNCRFPFRQLPGGRDSSTCFGYKQDPSAVSHAVVSVLLDSAMVVVVGVVLMVQNRTLFTATVLVVPLFLVLIGLFSGPYQRLHRQHLEQAAALEAALVESLSGISIIKACAAEAETRRRTEIKFLKTLATAFKDARLRNIQGSLYSGLTSLVQLAILWIGVWRFCGEPSAWANSWPIMRF